MKRKIILSSIFFLFFLTIFSENLKYFSVKTTYTLPSGDKKVSVIWKFEVIKCDLNSGFYTFKVFPEVKYKNVYGEIEVNIKNGKLYRITVFKKIGGKFRKYEKNFKDGTDFFLDTYGGMPVFVLPKNYFKGKSGNIEIKKKITLDKCNKFLERYGLNYNKSEIVVSDLNHKRKLGTFKYGNFFWWKESQIYNMDSKLLDIKYEK